MGHVHQTLDAIYIADRGSVAVTIRVTDKSAKTVRTIRAAPRKASLQASALTLDGGDHATAVLTLLLVPVTLTDIRWHWERTTKKLPHERKELARLLALSALIVARVQVAGIYFDASMAKLGVEEWKDGTALYYWLTEPNFGASSWLMPALIPLLTNGVTVALLTWGTILFEVVLFMALVMSKRGWGVLLAFGVAFHVAIAVVQGLISFSIAMIAALLLYLRPVEKEFNFRLGCVWNLQPNRLLARR